MIGDCHWLRASHVEEIMFDDCNNTDINKHTIFLTPVCSFIGFLAGRVAIGSPSCNLSTGLYLLGAYCAPVISFATGALIGRYLDSPNKVLQDRRWSYLGKEFNKINPYEIVRGADLAHILTISSYEAQKKILAKAHPTQLKNTLDITTDLKIQTLIKSFLPHLSAVLYCSEETKIEREKEVLEKLAQNITQDNLETCEKIFGDIYLKAVSHFLTLKITDENVQKIFRFAIDNHLGELENGCLFFTQHVSLSNI